MSPIEWWRKRKAKLDRDAEKARQFNQLVQDTYRVPSCPERSRRANGDRS